MALSSPTPANQQPANGIGVAIPCGARRFRSGGSPFWSPVCWSCRCVEGSLNRRWDPILPGCGWLHEQQLFSNQPIGSRFPHHVPHHAGRCRPGGSPVSSALCWCCRYVERCIIRGWTLSFAGAAEPRHFPDGQLLPCARRPPIGRGRARGPLDNGIRARKTLDCNAFAYHTSAKSALFARHIFSYLAAPSEGCR